MTAAPVVYRIRSVSLPAGAVVAGRDLSAALQRALAAHPGAAGSASLSIPGGRVTVAAGASLDEIVTAIAAHVHERLRGGAT